MIATIVLFVLFLLIICLVFATNVILKQALVCAYLTSSSCKPLSFVLIIMSIFFFLLNFVWLKLIFMFFTIKP